MQQIHPGANLYVFFEGISEPVALVDCVDLIEHFASIFPGWEFNQTTEGNYQPALRLSRRGNEFILDGPHLPDPLSRNDKTAAINMLVAELVRLYVQQNENLLCLHAAAVEIAEKLVVFPSQYRAGKSILSACLAANGLPVFCDDVLPIRIDNGIGIAPGLAPRLRLPLPDNLSPETLGFINSRRGLEGENYLYLDLKHGELADRGRHAPVGAFVLLERNTEAAAEIIDISEADILRQVIWQNFARKAEAPRILDTVSRLVGSAARYRLRYDRAEDAVALLEETFGNWRQDLPEHVSVLTRKQETGHKPAAIPGHYLRNPDVQALQVDGQVFLADKQGEAIHHLNLAGNAIWTLLAEPITPDKIHETIMAAFPGLEADQVRQDINDVLEQLLAKGLVTGGSN